MRGRTLWSMSITSKLGTQGPDVFPLALGCMGMGNGSWYGTSDDMESIATIHEALERGINLLDTGDFYGMGRNELLLGKALAGGHRDRAVLSVKFGAQIAPNGAFVGADMSPAALKTALSYTLARLGVDHIDIYRPAGLDPKVPIEETIGAIGEMVKAGYVRHIGLSEVGPETIRRAAKEHPIVDLQIEYSLLSRGPEAKIFPVLKEHGIAVTAYGVLSRGLLTGSKPAAGDFRAHMPRFESAEQNRPLVEALARTAVKHAVTPAQLCIAWALAKGKAESVQVVPTMGMRTRRHLAETLGALAVTLDPTDITALEAAVPASAVQGTRYPQAMMGALDSER